MNSPSITWGRSRSICPWIPFLTLCLLLYIPCANTSSASVGAQRPEQAFLAQDVANDHDDMTRSYSTTGEHGDPQLSTNTDPLRAMIKALEVMQEQYYEAWLGMWPTAIDWTAAVVATQVSAALSTLSTSFEYSAVSDITLSASAKARENMINRYFSQVVASYFGQDAFALRNEAYDDMLWVVLEWLETIKFINLHNTLHYKEPYRGPHNAKPPHSSWYGTQWIPAFAHRARIFWDLASKGWDTSLCNGGMLWSPYLAPYKNAITNELFITASISMYLYFPGDDNPSPFEANHASHDLEQSRDLHDPKYLAAAVEGYKWLVLSNMTDDQGLYVDGYHISGWKRGDNNRGRNTKCDDRNEMVYTYNQGVILSGQRGLWEATGSRSYLEDGHKLIINTINATGYDLKKDKPFGGREANNHSRPRLGAWHGLGRSGILEEACDAFGRCWQDAQAFKGIFFHHLTLFCERLPPHFVEPGETFNVRDFQDLRDWHAHKCKSYRGWITRNAYAATNTKDNKGRYGMWWGAVINNQSEAVSPIYEIPSGAIDYRNEGIPQTHEWRDPTKPWPPLYHDAESVNNQNLFHGENQDLKPRDVNDRGRGRTVETQSGGIAVLRAMQEIVNMHDLS